jgi:uncharacterized protein (TIGR02145 family)
MAISGTAIQFVVSGIRGINKHIGEKLKAIELIIATALFAPLFSSWSQTDHIVEIGEQEWMIENLNVRVFRNGDPIPEAQTNATWEKAGDEGQPAWCYYGMDSTYEDKYGKLYNWYAVNDPRGIAPQGWHVPSNYEWQTLIDYLGGESVAGGKMKESGITYWKSPNTGATNKSGFAALAGGLRYSDGEFNDLGDDAYFWSSTEYSSDYAWYRILGYYFSNVYRNYYDKQHGFSVRCIRDLE